MGEDRESEIMKIDQIEKALATLRKYWGDDINEKDIEFIEGQDEVKIIFSGGEFDFLYPSEQKRNIHGFNVRFPRSASLHVDTTSKEYALRYAINRLVVERADDHN
jgi:hypothetical protein